ncbi:hypothetical protein [Fulvivirga ligni]|uniref:hypothetical protein n=1 Tax=Fulvivirga ligni TaxID=2904246 RepID=UPI001F42BD19|nr:hypothetical protein [Fulvivirga ligni]UII21708.1 hypothetical protein LVD16_00455 [Fulvivirga ligni]
MAKSEDSDDTIIMTLTEFLESMIEVSFWAHYNGTNKLIVQVDVVNGLIPVEFDNEKFETYEFNVKVKAGLGLEAATNYTASIRLDGEVEDGEMEFDYKATIKNAGTKQVAFVFEGEAKGEKID